MSVLRKLQPSRHASASSVSKSTTPTLYLDVPSYGALYLRTPRDPSQPCNDDSRQDPDRLDYILRGTLIVTIPPSLGRRKCRQIRVGMRSVCRLDLGPKRRHEEDILFDRMVEVDGDDSEGLWLEPGVQKYEFNIIIPANLAQHDWHSNASIRHVLYATVQGPRSASSAAAASASSSKPLFSTLRSRSSSSLGIRSKSASRAKSPHVSQPSSPKYAQATLPSPSLDQTASPGMGLASLPASPGVSGSDDKWIKGSYSTERAMMVVYLPEDEQVASLSVDLNGVADDIGVWNLTLESHPWSVSAILNAKFTISALSPKATIFSTRLVLTQTTSIVSPRDDPEKVKPLVTKRAFSLASEGKQLPPEFDYPPRNWPALWRGTEAGGSDTADLELRLRGKLPTDDVGRPSTVEGVMTPIKVTHTLHLEVLLAVWGVGPAGERLHEAGPGGARKLVISRQVSIPSCALVHQTFTLPSYDEVKEDGKPIEGGTLMPSGILPRHSCACGLLIEDMETRMQRTVDSERAGGVDWSSKGEEARGRRM